MRQTLAKVCGIALDLLRVALWLTIVGGLCGLFVNELWRMRTGERLYTPGFLADSERREYARADPLRRRYRLHCRAGTGTEAREYFVTTWLYCSPRGSGGCTTTIYSRAFAFWSPGFGERYFIYKAKMDREDLDERHVFRTAPVARSQEIWRRGGEPAYWGDEAVFELAVGDLDFTVYPDPNILERSSRDFFWGRRTETAGLAPLRGRCVALPPPAAAD